jgi:hypothetical protein
MERVSSPSFVEDQEKNKEDTAKGGPMRGGKNSLLYIQ